MKRLQEMPTCGCCSLTTEGVRVLGWEDTASVQVAVAGQGIPQRTINRGVRGAQSRAPCPSSSSFRQIVLRLRGIHQELSRRQEQDLVGTGY